ncbi:MAG: class I SAM-dependent methyltransferase [Gemmatimonadota bacterium]
MKPSHFGPDAWEPLVEAWEAFHRGESDAVLEVHADDGGSEPLPVAVFFRSRESLRPPDREALARVRGRVLDVGAGVGALSLLLQEDEVPVTALEVIPGGAEIMRDRGVRDVREGRLEDLSTLDRFDTILLLMNGTALAGTLEGLPGRLEILEGLLAPGGQILVDSTDLGEEGEIQYQLEFRGRRGAPFPQLFLGPDALREMALQEGWKMEVVWREMESGGGGKEGDETGGAGEYLARLERG